MLGTMVSGDRRYCDVCNIPILSAEPYYVGEAPPGTDDVLRDNIRTAPTFTPLADGRIMFELCWECVQRAPLLQELMSLVQPPSTPVWYTIEHGKRRRD